LVRSSLSLALLRRTLRLASSLRIRVPWGVRLAILLAVPGVLLWWFGTHGSLTDITSPGAALIIGVMIFGWVSGASRGLRRRVIARAGGAARS
jgi:hypothetical protein